MLINFDKQDLYNTFIVSQLAQNKYCLNQIFILIDFCIAAPLVFLKRYAASDFL